MEQIQSILINFIRSLFPANIWTWDYFAGLWNRYANVGGFLTGAIVIALVYYASDEDYGKKRGMIRVFAVIALINAVDGIYTVMMNIVNSICFHQFSSSYESIIQGAFNPLSIMILVLVISECYRNKQKNAFFFGVSTYSVSFLLFGSGYPGDIALLFLCIRVVVISIICLLCTKITYAFVSYIVMGVYFLVAEAMHSYIFLGYQGSTKETFVKDFASILGSYKAEYVIITFIAIVFALFEIFILTEGKLSIKNLGIRQAIVSLILTVCMLASCYGILFYSDLTNVVIDTQKNNKENVTYENIHPSYAESSSYLSMDSSNTYGPEYTIDGSNETCWQDGQDGDGIGETLTYYFDSPVTLDKIAVVNGRVNSEDKYYENNRIAEANVYYYLDDENVGEQAISFKDVCSSDPSCFETDKKLECNKVVLEITHAFYGTKYQDLCVTEVLFGNDK